MEKLKEKIRRVPRWGWLIGIFSLGAEYAIYLLGVFLSRLIGTAEHALIPKIPWIDDRIPVVAVFIVIYLFSYIFWISGPISVSLTKRENFINYLIGLSLAYLIGFLFFVFLPTKMDREAEGLLEIGLKPGIWNKILGFVYRVDGDRTAFNLFPSYHCLASLYCYLGVRKQPEISKGYKAYTLVMTVLICLSTVFTKQHYFMDIIGGLLLALVSYLVTEQVNPAKRILKECT